MITERFRKISAYTISVLLYLLATNLLKIGTVKGRKWNFALFATFSFDFNKTPYRISPFDNVDYVLSFGKAVLCECK
jgi:hypothetical protein